MLNDDSGLQVLRDRLEALNRCERRGAIGVERRHAVPVVVLVEVREVSGEEHVAALSDALSEFGRTARLGINEMNELDDADSADILTEISRGVDKWLWFVEAHQQGKTVAVESGRDNGRT